MLTDTRLRSLKPKPQLYKIPDRDGMYAAVTASGAISFRYNYSISGRQETLTLGRYGTVSLAEARSRLQDAKKLIAAGRSPAREKARSKARRHTAQTFGEWAEKWFLTHRMADSTRAVRRSIYDRDIKAPFEKCKLPEITHEDLRKLTDAMVARGAPSSALHAREVIMQVYRWAKERGVDVENPADLVRPKSIAKLVPRDRVLSPAEIGVMDACLDRVSTAPANRTAARLLLLTMVRKSELIQATWDEVDFGAALWSIPKARMKQRNAHNVYLSRQALALFAALKDQAGGSRYVLPSRYNPDAPMAGVTLNKVLTLAHGIAEQEGGAILPFCPHDLRRTSSTLLHEAGYDTDWVEKCLAHEQKGVRGVYNRAEYREQRAGMLQDWADMVDGWTVKPE